jgi:hypothetical protein
VSGPLAQAETTIEGQIDTSSNRIGAAGTLDRATQVQELAALWTLEQLAGDQIAVGAQDR